MTKRGFTYLELIMSLTLIAVLSAALVPTTQKIVKRQKETELRRSLLEMRTAIDRFKKAHEEGTISVRDLQQQGYPKDFEELINGAPLADTSGGSLRFLRRIPIDPMTGEAEWGMRSVQDEPDDASWGRENLFDVYSLSDGVALDGTEYSTW
jgi:general secretion pathway protein G